MTRMGERRKKVVSISEDGCVLVPGLFPRIREKHVMGLGVKLHLELFHLRGIIASSILSHPICLTDIRSIEASLKSKLDHTSSF